jgi:hypothetical protein
MDDTRAVASARRIALPKGPLQDVTPAGGAACSGPRQGAQKWAWSEASDPDVLGLHTQTPARPASMVRRHGPAGKSGGNPWHNTLDFAAVCSA